MENQGAGNRSYLVPPKKEWTIASICLLFVGAFAPFLWGWEAGVLAVGLLSISVIIMWAVVEYNHSTSSWPDRALTILVIAALTASTYTIYAMAPGGLLGAPAALVVALIHNRGWDFRT